MMRMLDSFEPAENFGTMVFDAHYAFPIRVFQHPTRKHGSFAVQYGKQLDHHLGYTRATKALGEAILHGLACQGQLDNNRD